LLPYNIYRGTNQNYLHPQHICCRQLEVNVIILYLYLKLCSSACNIKATKIFQIYCNPQNNHYEVFMISKAF